MHLPKELSLAIRGWSIGVRRSSRWLMVGIAWEKGPASAFVTIPLFRFWIVRDRNWHLEPWPAGWSLARLMIWKTEMRLDLDWNIWGIGVSGTAFSDCVIHAGPFSIQVETDKMYDVDWLPGVATLRLFFPKGRSLRPWPPWS